MSDELVRCLRCRNYAEELRIIAACGESALNRASLLEIANSYDKMADSLEAALRSRKNLDRLSAS